jgi:hypothetical protein
VHGPSPHLSGLNGVAAISAKDAWAVGDSDEAGPLSMTSRTLIEHWNGRVRKVVKSPSPPDGAFLQGVSAWSANDIWAVGWSGDFETNASRTLILHWNGSTWTPVSSPAGSGSLSGLAVVSARDPVNATVIEQWNGKTWKQIPGSP